MRSGHVDMINIFLLYAGGHIYNWMRMASLEGWAAYYFGVGDSNVNPPESYGPRVFAFPVR